mmetsp:Transcript_50719/g.152753  ORF Transcript_50719/g.152753 Transcript_50719/m.152753 type:complete len:351 (-) Transcript_50719:1150-2202(-)
MVAPNHGVVSPMQRRHPGELPAIWRTLDPLIRAAVREAIDVAMAATTTQLGYDAPTATHTATILFLSLAFHAKNTNSVTEAINTYLLPSLSPDECDDADTLARQWDAVLGPTHGAPSYNDVARIFAQAKVPTIPTWAQSTIVMEHWRVLCHLFLGRKMHPGIAQMENFLATTDSLKVTLGKQAKSSLSLGTAVIRVLQTEYNESFCQYLWGTGPVIWPDLAKLNRGLATGKFKPEQVSLPFPWRSSSHPPPSPTHQPRTNPAAAPTLAAPWPVPMQPTRQWTPGGGGRSQQPDPNLTSYQELKVGHIKFRPIIEWSATQPGGTIPLTDEGNPFFMTYHYKATCNSRFGGK